MPFIHGLPRVKEVGLSNNAAQTSMKSTSCSCSSPGAVAALSGKIYPPVSRLEGAQRTC